MLFQVKVVSQAEYDDYLASLRDEGKVGLLGNEYDTNTNQPNNEAPAEASSDKK